jgi:hypothetical protein
MPAVSSFAPSSQSPNPSAEFTQDFTTLLNLIQKCWMGNASFGEVRGQMATVGYDGVSLIQQGVTPQFAYAATAAASGR